jgi:hypothetical protein
MNRRWNLPGLVVPVGLALLIMAVPQGTQAGEITLFWARNSPRATWRDAPGATLTLGLAKVAQLEVEGARGLDAESVARMTYFTAGAALKLPLTPVTPFAGLGVGVYYQTLGDSWMFNTHGAAFAGVKAHIADLIVLRVEYRRFQMRGTPFRQLDSRIALGAGIAF